MNPATMNGLPVLSALVTLPLTGAWTAEVAVDSRESPSGAVSIECAGESFRGRSVRAGVVRDTLMVRVVGGGGLAVALAPKFWRGATAEVVLRDTLDAAGMALADSTDAAVLAKALEPAWSRTAGPCGDAIRALAERLGVEWRVLADGAVWLGEETWPVADIGEYQVVDEDPKSGRMEIGADSPTLTPGVTFAGRRVVKVEHRFSADALRTAVWFETAAASSDDIGVAIEGLVRHMTAHCDYFAQYPAKVYAQNSDGTLELRPDDARLPDYCRVPIRYGIPGVTAKIAAGARVMVGFEAGDPGRPVATVWESASVTEIVFAGGTKYVAVADHTHSLTGVTFGGYSAVGAMGSSDSNSSTVKA